MKRVFYGLIVCLSFSCNNDQPAGKQSAVSSTPLTVPGTASPDTSSSLSTFSPGFACLLTEISYCAAIQDTVAKYIPAWKVIWDPASRGGNHAFLATNGTAYALSIRGSLISFTEDAFNNWIRQDLNVAEQAAWPFSGKPGAMISAGSEAAWGNIAVMKDGTGKTLLQMLDSLMNDHTPLLITGHSLGGNLATVVATWIDAHFKKQNSPHPDINVITFAAPAAGNAVFADDFNQRFPLALRYENRYDIVPKFPVAEKVAELQDLYHSGPAVQQIKVGYGFLKVPFSTIINGIQLSLHGLSMRTGYSAYVQTNGQGTPVSIPLSGKNNEQNAVSWFAEAGYQHGAEQYAKALGAPVITAR